MNLQLNHIWLSSKIGRGRAPRAVSAPVVKMPKRQLYFAPIDLVEDRTRTRVVGVGVMMEVTSGRRVLLRVASGGIADAYVHGD